MTAPEVPHAERTAEGALVSRLRTFTEGGKLDWGDEDRAADAIMRLRAERDALAHVIEQAKVVTSEMADTDEYPLEFYWRARILRHLDAAPAVSLALHDAEVWDEGHEQGYDSGLYARNDDEPETVEVRSLAENPYRAAAIRDGGK